MSIGSGADFGQSQSVRRWFGHKPGGRLRVLSASPVVTFLARKRHYLLISTKINCWVMEARVCEQLAQSHYLAVQRAKIESWTLGSPVCHAVVTTLSYTVVLLRW